jgi:hypothetical protein
MMKRSQFFELKHVNTIFDIFSSESALPVALAPFYVKEAFI